jgi:hypothetical protein
VTRTILSARLRADKIVCVTFVSDAARNWDCFSGASSGVVHATASCPTYNLINAARDRSPVSNQARPSS